MRVPELHISYPAMSKMLIVFIKFTLKKRNQTFQKMLLHTTERQIGKLYMKINPHFYFKKEISAKCFRH